MPNKSPGSPGAQIRHGLEGQARMKKAWGKDGKRNNVGALQMIIYDNTRII